MDMGRRSSQRTPVPAGSGHTKRRTGEGSEAHLKGLTGARGRPAKGPSEAANHASIYRVRVHPALDKIPTRACYEYIPNPAHKEDKSPYRPLVGN